MTLLAVLIILFPLFSAAVTAVLGAKLLRGQSHWPVWLGAGGAVVCSVLLAGLVWGQLHQPDAPSVWRLGPNERPAEHSPIDHRPSAAGNVSVSFHATGAGQAGEKATPALFPADFNQRVPSAAHSIVLYRWLTSGLRNHDNDNLIQPGSFFDFTLFVDPLTVIMLLTVTIVALPIFIYSRGYMAGDDGYWRFFSYMGLFLFSMCLLVLAGNFLVLYMGWELVGLCSYLLIGFYYKKPSARAAAVKAFVVNRIGDFGFLIGILMLWHYAGSLDYQVVLTPQTARALADQHVLTPICLLLFCGAVGKSAQFPLYVWLLDAMEGPSPVSALIHAATMVTAGVYLVARASVLFAYPYDAWSTPMIVVTAVGCFSAAYAGVCACCQYDMKRILAFSTMSQLGYMFVAAGSGAPESAIFHLHTHAFFKALLFLGAGAVMHAMGGVIDLRKFGGLRRDLPLVWITFVIGGLALAGFPLFSGFWSKDEIGLAAMSQSPLVGWIMLGVNLLTALYTFRMIAWAFHGPRKLPDEVMQDGHAHIHQPGWTMSGALVFLALGAVFVGYVGVSFGHHGFLGRFVPGAETVGNLAAADVTPDLFHGFLQSAVVTTGLLKEIPWLMNFSAILAMAGVLVGFVLYCGSRRVPALLLAALPRTYLWVANKFYVDQAYDRAVVRPLHKAGETGDLFDEKVLTGSVYGVGALATAIGFLLRVFQRGRLQGYALGMIAGVILIVALTAGSMRPGGG